jgi:hypothetical protein
MQSALDAIPLRRLAGWVSLAALVLAFDARAAPVFEDDTVLDVTLRGPIASLTRKKASRDEAGFVLTAGGRAFDVEVRLRGHSRVKLCRFPPLRLNFSRDAVAGTMFDGLNKVKLVTHCKDGERAMDSLHNEYLAYRIFAMFSGASYRVRELRVTYEETEGRNAGRGETHPAFLIEPQETLAARLGGEVVESGTVRYSQLDARQLARVAVFEYLIGNADWSMATAQAQDECCHNIDLVATPGGWQAVPYDFDLSVLADARYTGPFAVRQAAARAYQGYCVLPEEVVRETVREVRARRDEIMALARAVPAEDTGRLEDRVAFLEDFFDKDETALLAEFARDCRGRR